MSKTIAVVGAGPGIGMAVAERFGREGFNVALLARNPTALAGHASNLKDIGVGAAAFPTDVLDRVALANSIDEVISRFGSVDVLEYGPTPSPASMRLPRDTDVENEQFHLNLQVLGAIAAVRAVLPAMLERETGTLLFTTAASAQHPAPITGSFGIAAGALLNYVRLLNKDLAANGVHAGLVSVAGLVVPPGKTAADNASDFPPGIPLVAAEDVAELHWRMHRDRDQVEVFAGDIDVLLANKQLY
ncbi:SDR family NAD(P)-dependent oxidoreductase [Xanthobacter autotrophicus]|uniref:SDR family NAD(P)-dependent oxidoreductase n=1 Tax=Xanthobacter autotrophicus TaxID=280 RepID=UPI00372B2B75